MIYLSLAQTKKLNQLGFRVTVDEIEQASYHIYKENIWITGGCFFPPSKAMLAIQPFPDKESERLITMYEMIEWLTERVSFEFVWANDGWRGLLKKRSADLLEFNTSSLPELLYEMIVTLLTIQPSLAESQHTEWYPFVE